MLRKIKMQATNQEKISPRHMPNKEIVSRIYKECSQYNNMIISLQIDKKYLNPYFIKKK